MKKKEIQITFKLDEELYKEFKKYLIDHDMKIKDCLSLLIKKEVQK